MTERLDRPSARVVVVDESGCVLLFRIDDPQDAGPPVWITPGGGVDAGESIVDAASRELFEETGLRAGADDLGAPVAVSSGDWVFRGLPLHSVDWFFALRANRFAPDVEGFTELEREIQGEARWWHPDELDETNEVVVPNRLAQLARLIAQGQRPDEPIELPWEPD